MTRGSVTKYAPWHSSVVLSHGYDLLQFLSFILLMLKKFTSSFVNYTPRSRVSEFHIGIGLASTRKSAKSHARRLKEHSYNHSHSSSTKNVNQELFQRILLRICSTNNEGRHSKRISNENRFELNKRYSGGDKRSFVCSYVCVDR